MLYPGGQLPVPMEVFVSCGTCADPDAGRCRDSRAGYPCTRSPGHTGDHTHCGEDSHDALSWPQAKPVEQLDLLDLLGAP